MESKITKKKQKTGRSKKKVEQQDADEGVIGEGEELHSLTHYVADEELLVHHMFAAIQGTKLEAMMPAVLKAIPVQDLKLLCIHELRGISKQRIISIIQGNPMSDSSGSDEEAAAAAVAPDDAHTKRRSSGRQMNGDAHTPTKSKSGKKDSEDKEGNLKPMDILELEMRARIIKTMLDKKPKARDAAALSQLATDAEKAAKRIKDSSHGKVKSEPLSDTESRRSRSRSHSGNRSYTSSRSSYSRSHSRSRSRNRSSRSRSNSSRSRSRGSSSGDRSKRKSRGSHSQSRRDKYGRKKSSHGSSSKKRNRSRSRSATEESDTAGSKKPKKTRISRKEFEDRMRKAKKNRTYRKRKDSEDEEKLTSDSDNSVKSIRVKNMKKSSDDTAREEKKEGEEDSEKEEGEIDSNEEDQESDYDNKSMKKHKKKRRHSGSSSYSSRSRSNSSNSNRSRGGSKSRNGGKKRKDKGRSQRGNNCLPVDKKLIVATLNDSMKTLDKSKPDIETVDSEEDFDNVNGNHNREIKGEPGTNMVPRTDRVNVSFSFNKKSQLQQGTDLEFGMSFSRPTTFNPQPTKDQIVISSDSDNEAKSKRKKSMLLLNSQDNAEGTNLNSENNNSIKDASRMTSNSVTEGNKNSSDTGLNADQSDLTLCEETVMMKDILGDSDQEEDDRSRIKKESDIKVECAEVEMQRPAIAVDKYHHKDINIGIDTRKENNVQVANISELNTSNSSDDNHSFKIKQELLSPRAENESARIIQSINIKPEPYDENPEEVEHDSEAEKRARSDGDRGIIQTTDSMSSSAFERTMEKDNTMIPKIGGNVGIRFYPEGESDRQMAELSGEHLEKKVSKLSDEVGNHNYNQKNIISEKIDICMNKEYDSCSTADKDMLSNNEDIDCESKENVCREIDLPPKRKSRRQSKEGELGQETVLSTKRKSRRQSKEEELDQETVLSTKRKSRCESKTEFDRESDQSFGRRSRRQSKEEEEKLCREELEEDEHESCTEHAASSPKKHQFYNKTSDDNFSNQVPGVDETQHKEVPKEDSTGAFLNITETTGDTDDDDDEGGGLVDLPATEHFEIEEDEDEGNLTNYDIGGLESLQEPEDDETSTEKTDFYRGAEQLNFSDEEKSCLDSAAWKAVDSKESPPSESLWASNNKTKEKTTGTLMEEGIGYLKPMLVENASPVASDTPQETEDVADEDAHEDEEEDGGLVELHPEEAEALASASHGGTKLKKQGNTEIIGEIEPSTNSAFDISHSGSSWSTRWLQSEKVQKVVSSSKMLNRMRNRIKKGKRNARTVAALASINTNTTDTTSVGTTSSPVPSATAAATTVVSTTTATASEKSSQAEATGATVGVIRSLEEYQQMMALSSEPNATDSTPPTMAPDGGDCNTAAHSDGSSEDSEEEELWSKIMGS